ncbi:MAG: biotin/lipoyl-binding protein, partial [Burkholderiales bacterium]
MNRGVHWLFTRRANNAQAHAGVSDPALIARIQAFRQQNAQQAVLDQYNDIYLFHLQSPRAWARYGLWSAALVLVVFIGWAAWFNLDEVTSAQGKVITSSREQVVQSMEAGVVTDILVKEGQVVEAGQPLLRIDDVKIGANMQETKARIHALRASAIRL